MKNNEKKFILTLIVNYNCYSSNSNKQQKGRKNKRK